jgi:hypothetical protein
MATSASREATTALHTGEDARIEVIVPSVRTSSSQRARGRATFSIAPDRSNLDTFVVVG